MSAARQLIRYAGQESAPSRQPTKLVWTEALDETLRRLAGEGKTSAEIAAVMAMTRNAVCGRAARLGVRFTSQQTKDGTRCSAEPRALGTAKRIAPAQHVKAKVSPAPQRALPAPPEAPRSMLPPEGGIVFTAARDNQCRFPVDLHAMPSADMRVCGGDVLLSSSWCERHFHRVFQNSERMLERLQKGSRR